MNSIINIFEHLLLKVRDLQERLFSYLYEISDEFIVEPSASGLGLFNQIGNVVVQLTEQLVKAAAWLRINVDLPPQSIDGVGESLQTEYVAAG